MLATLRLLEIRIGVGAINVEHATCAIGLVGIEAPMFPHLDLSVRRQCDFFVHPTSDLSCSPSLRPYSFIMMKLTIHYLFLINEFIVTICPPNHHTRLNFFLHRIVTYRCE